MEYIENVEAALQTVYDKRYIEKLNAVLSKNRGLVLLRRLDNVLKGKQNDREERDSGEKYFQNFTPNEYACLIYAPLVCCDVERIFSQYKTVLADNGRRFTFEHLKQHLIIKCNPST